jgi:hypothetical protein
MPKAAKKSKPVKRASKAVKPKMMTVGEADRLSQMIYDAELKIMNAHRYTIGTPAAAALSKRMISCADALYKAAGVK